MNQQFWKTPVTIGLSGTKDTSEHLPTSNCYGCIHEVLWIRLGILLLQPTMSTNNGECPIHSMTHDYYANNAEL